MRTVKIKFVDFWYGFAPEGNFIFEALSILYKVEICDDPEILIYGCYGLEHLKYDCIKVYYTSENFRPDYSGCDYALTFDYSSDPRHYRLPLYAFYMNEIGEKKLLQERTREEAMGIWRKKTKFCCMVVSNGESKKRLQIFDKLSKYKHIDSGGMVLNNIGGPVKDKMTFISDYRFVFAFESKPNPGYTTEKIVEPLLKDCIPLYWGNPLVGNDFNEACFLNLANGMSDDDFIKKIIDIDRDEEKAIKMLMVSKFAGGVIPSDINIENLAKFFDKIIIDAPIKIPVSKTFKKYIHLFKVRKIYYSNRISGIVKDFFNISQAIKLLKHIL